MDERVVELKDCETGLHDEVRSYPPQPYREVHTITFYFYYYYYIHTHTHIHTHTYTHSNPPWIFAGGELL